MNSEKINHGSLFSGIGGFDLASHWVGWNNLFQVEKDEWCRKVLQKNFPTTKRYGDIKDFNGKEYKGTVDIISGGFPCQPFSFAGKRRGKEDDRYLWNEMFRIITEIKPTFIVGENVTGIVNMALDTVLSDLETQGYATETFIIPACSKGAWHKRDRVWIIAYSDYNDLMRASRKNEATGNRKRLQKWNEMEHTNFSGDLWRKPIFSNTNHTGQKEQRQPITDETEHFAPKCSSWWQAEPLLDRVAHGIPNRVDRLKGLGNAIVPQVAYELFCFINLILQRIKNGHDETNSTKP